MPTRTVAAVPGIRSVDPQAVALLADVAESHGWYLDGLAAAIAHESGWKPTAKNPAGAVGLLQWTPSTLAKWGLSAADVVTWPAKKQIPLVERYFATWEAAGYRPSPRDFLTVGLGAGNAPAGPLTDDQILYAPESAGALANPALTDSDGAIRVGRMRLELEKMLNAAGDARIEIPESKSSSPAPTKRGTTGWGFVLAVLATAGAIYAVRRR